MTKPKSNIVKKIGTLFASTLGQTKSTKPQGQATALPHTFTLEKNEKIALERIEEAAQTGAIELDLSRLGLTSLPPELGKLTNLTLLKAGRNRLTSLPPEIWQLANLTSLELGDGGNQLTTLPPKIENLTNLTSLDLSENQLTSLPPEIGKLTKLTSLKVRRNQLASLPPELWQLTNLTSLDIGGNQLTSLPSEIGQLSNLTLLKLGDSGSARSNQFASLPSEIWQLANLTSLDLSRQQLTSLPPEIRQLTKLISLELHGNQFTSLPLDLLQLTNLTSLGIGGNRFTSLPPEIWQLTNLTSLNLSNNQLATLPPGISQLTNLTSLHLWKTKLTILPPDFWQLTNLTSLNLGWNLFTDIPPEIGNLVNLTSLDLGMKRLTKLPPEIGHLTKLSSLNLSFSELTSLPPEIGNLVSLNSLDLSENLITDIPPEIGQLTNLTSISLRYNKLTSLPPEIGRLTELTSLDIGLNKLTSLPPEIGQLNRLESLILSNRFIGSEKIELDGNKIKNLPREILKLKMLKELDLRDNALDISPEILEKTKEPQVILSYLANLLIGKYKPLAETKMLVVGQGSVGKTSLIRRLAGGKFNPTEIKTDGIAIAKWQVPNQQQGNNQPKTLRVNIWDFGGQEIMHATHQFFLTKRSLYLLVMDARLTQEENRVEYWLKIIQSFGGESPILVVGNKTDQHPLDIDRSGLQKKYPNIMGFLETSAANGMGLDELRASIAVQANALPHIQDAIPEAWFNVKKELEDLGHNQNFISHDKYVETCSRLEVNDKISQHTLIGFLHDLGSVLHFQDDPRLESLGILNPLWVTNGVYKILNAPALFQNKGVLNLSMLSEILVPSDYPSNNRLFIVDMMKRFELCFDVETDKVFLVPDLLPKDEPSMFGWEDALAFQYLYPVLPSSIMTRFIVRMNRQIAENLVWRNGVILQQESNRILVKADGEDRRLSILVNGPEYTRRDVLAAIRHQLDDIHSSIKGLTPKRKIPIPGHPHVEPLDYEYLLQLERNGFHEIPVKYGDGLISVDVKKLLNGLESEETRYTTNIIISGHVENSNIVVGDGNILNLEKGAQGNA